MTASTPPPLVAVVCPLSASASLQRAAVSWVGTLTGRHIGVVVDPWTALGGVVLDAAVERIHAEWWGGDLRGPEHLATVWRRFDRLRLVAVFGVPEEAARARTRGAVVREWDSNGGAL